MMHSTRLCVIISVLAALIAGMMIATTARADALRGDPRKCSFSSDPRVCAYEAARLVLRHFLAVRTNSSTPFYQGITSCSPATTTTILRWKCSWGAATNAGPPAGTAIVVFRALSTGWKRQVTVTSG